MRIAVDVMGGDHGCTVAVEGVKRALALDPTIEKIYLVGQQQAIAAAQDQSGLNDPRAEVVPATEVLTMDDKPLEGIRKKKDSSMVKAIELVYERKADAVISPGNTGALVAGSMKLRRLDGVKRPAIAARMPSRSSDFVLLAAGANDTCEPLHLAQFAVMGNIYAREILGLEKPRVGILSNGSEETKGNNITREAARLCSQLDLNFIGYVEGFHLFEDGVDVVVTDGFTGNVVLKTAESLSRAIIHLLRNELLANPIRKFGATLSRGAFRSLKHRVDPEVYGGAVILGLNGIVVKAHGSSRERAIMNAIRVATEEISHGVNQSISRHMNNANKQLASDETHTAPSVTA